jgi:Holliday junction resolvasome RuvABC DNA-binding subunit
VSAIDELATELSKLPGIGRKTALRLTYHLLKQQPEQSVGSRTRWPRSPTACIRAGAAAI